MKVTISFYGIVHSFYLAEQLQKRGYLEKIITSYPKFAITKWKGKVNSEQIVSIPTHFIYHCLSKIKLAKLFDYKLGEIFDKLASKKIGSSDIFVGRCGSCLECLKKAKNKGIITVVEDGILHPLPGQQTLEQEYKKFGLKFRKNKKLEERMQKEREEADYVYVPSKFVKKKYIEYGIPEEKIIQVPYGVDPNRFRQLPKKDNIFRVVFVGGLGLRKGIHYLLKAFSELKLQNSELLLIGPIYEPEIRQFLDKYKGSYNWIGPKPNTELYKYLSQSSVFVLPSLEEGFGLVIPQAMACGLPVICTENTGGPDIIRDGREGFVVPIRDVEALKEKILYLYNNPEKCKRMGYNAKKRVRENFTWDHYGERIVKKYKEILS